MLRVIEEFSGHDADKVFFHYEEDRYDNCKKVFDSQQQSCRVRSVCGVSFFCGEKVAPKSESHEFDTECNAPDTANHAEISNIFVVFCALVGTPHKLEVHDGLVYIHADDDYDE